MALQILGAGFGRTGTASLKLALEQLGFAPCYHMTEVIEQPAHIDLWLDVVAGKPNWDAILQGYQACVDFPVCSYYRELAEAYPEAKVLLSVRDPDKWFDSIHATIMSPKMVENISGTPFGELNRRTIWDTFGGRIHERAHMVECFKRHTEEVKAAIDPDRLLVYEVKQGWGPLCEFLGVAVPDAAFPHVNSTEETKKILEMLFSGSGGEPTESQRDEAVGQLYKREPDAGERH